MHSPFGGWRHHLSPASGGTITRAYCRAIYEESVSWCFILPPEQGEVRRSRKGGGERSEPIRKMLIIPYDTERQTRNADFISIARQGNPQPSARRAVKLKNPWARRGPSILRTFPFEPFDPSEPSEPSRRRRVHGRSPVNPHTAGVSINFPSLSVYSAVLCYN